MNKEHNQQMNCLVAALFSHPASGLFETLVFLLETESYFFKYATSWIIKMLGLLLQQQPNSPVEMNKKHINARKQLYILHIENYCRFLVLFLFYEHWYLKKMQSYFNAYHAGIWSLCSFY